ncbi:MAG: MATE family efflux transporter [Pseudomonadales bacterium]|nr:MATE family efflux transporter [Pseudomonadales bacterium]
MSDTTTGYRRILGLTWPIILANSATPLLGLVDTAIIGNLAGTAHLGAIALGALIFNFIYWGFGFLRMSTTGFVAQASGRNDQAAILETTLRALSMGLLIGLTLLLLQWPIIRVTLSLFGASAEVESISAQYFSIRIWGAPATLGLYALMGYFIGQGLSRRLLLMQLALNGLNISLDLLLAGHFNMGASGIALGTAISEWVVLFLALAMVIKHFKGENTALNLSLGALPWSALFQRDKIRPVLQANINLMIRTLFLLLGFAVFTDQGARFGDTTLAANHILLQFISFSAFFLDGFAFTCESLAGKALGQQNRSLFQLIIRRTSQLAAGTALLLAGGILLLGTHLLQWLTDLPQVQASAQSFLPFCALYVALSFAAFQLDGLFIGTTTTVPLRNASVLATSSFILLCYVLIPALANQGLWIAFISFVVLRAVFLGAYFKTLLAKLYPA